MKLSNYSKNKVLLKSNNRCFYCGISFVEGVKCEIDHFLPFSIHKDGTINNLVAACIRCNRIKSNKSLNDFRQILQKKYNQKILFFFEKYGIEIYREGVSFKHTLNEQTFSHNG